MTVDSRDNLREYYDAAASNYLERASKGFMGWMRKRELALTLSMIPAEDHRRALDAGCGPGYYSQVMRDRGFDVTAIDLSPEMVERVKRLGFPAYVMDIEHSDPPKELNAPFGFIFCAGVLEFAFDVQRFLGALRNMARDDAELVLVAPKKGLFGSIYRAYLQKRGIPARVYAPRSLASDLRAVGFEPLEIRTVWPICLVARARAISRSNDAQG
jgi:2-polyprenyl-3-methyl-5-hydroxy-6-metoxy-1,4-benzoquinol methylase